MSRVWHRGPNVRRSIIQSLGYGKINSLLLTVPPYFVAMGGYYICSWISDVSIRDRKNASSLHQRYNKIYMIIAGSMVAAIPTYILGMFASNTGGRYFSMCLMPVVGGKSIVQDLTNIASVVPQILIYKTMSLHVPRPHTKRAAGLAMVNAIGGISNVWTSYLWFGGPHYYAAFGTCECAYQRRAECSVMGCAIVWLITVTLYRFWVRNLNRKLAGSETDLAFMKRYHGVTQEQIDLGWRYQGF